MFLQGKWSNIGVGQGVYWSVQCLFTFVIHLLRYVKKTVWNYLYISLVNYLNGLFFVEFFNSFFAWIRWTDAYVHLVRIPLHRYSSAPFYSLNKPFIEDTFLYDNVYRFSDEGWANAYMHVCVHCSVTWPPSRSVHNC